MAKQLDACGVLLILKEHKLTSRGSIIIPDSGDKSLGTFWEIVSIGPGANKDDEELYKHYLGMVLSAGIPADEAARRAEAAGQEHRNRFPKFKLQIGDKVIVRENWILGVDGYKNLRFAREGDVFCVQRNGEWQVLADCEARAGADPSTAPVAPVKLNQAQPGWR
jgi:hypothetical protein